ncbi:Mitochondrial inner membrane protein OXA1 [Spathaspora sp. JA1]|nr:Mitochondrial inner membrane protein OXA1 [Spathaspora sp. JA1]
MLRVGLSRSLRVGGGSILRPIRTNQLRVGSRIVTGSTIPISASRFNSSSTTTTGVIDEIRDTLVPIDDLGLVDKVAATTLHSNELGYMDSIGLASGWGPTSLVTQFLELTHVYTGLPWWATIATATVLVRVALFPLYVKASTNATRMAKIKPQIDQLLETMKNPKNQADTMKAVAKRKKIMKDNNVSTLMTMAPLVQAPIAYGFFRALHNMASAPVEGFSTQGYAWFQDLCGLDTYLGLQFISTAAIIALIRLGGETGQSAMGPQFKNLMMALPVFSLIVTKDFTCGVLLYFAVNSILSFVQTMLFKSQFIRKLLKMPPKLTSKQLVEKSGGNKNEGMMDSFNNYLQQHKERAISSARKTDKQLEITQKRRRSAKEGYIKRH